MNISLLFPWILQFCPNYAIFDGLCGKLRFEVNYAKSQHRRILEALVNVQLLQWLAWKWRALKSSARQQSKFIEVHCSGCKVSQPLWSYSQTKWSVSLKITLMNCSIFKKSIHYCILKMTRGFNVHFINSFT